MHFVLVMKSHFDIGYSALARDVEHEYRTTMIDRALETLEGGNFAFFWTQGGVSICDTAGRGVGLCSPDAPALSLGEPGIYRFASQWPNPDGAGTLLRLWELAGTGGPMTVTLPAELKATKAQPVSLRGEPSGPPIVIQQNRLTFTLAAYAPASFLIERSE